MREFCHLCRFLSRAGSVAMAATMSGTDRWAGILQTAADPAQKLVEIKVLPAISRLQ
jgi:hypothetical protein